MTDRRFIVINEFNSSDGLKRCSEWFHDHVKKINHQIWLKNNKELLIFTYGEDWYKEQYGAESYEIQRKFRK